MKVLFTEPFSNFIPFRAGFYSPNIGILSMAAYLESQGLDVMIAEPWLLKSGDNLIKLIKQASPDVLAITCVTCTAYYAMSLAAYVKKLMPGIIIVGGGYHFSCVPEETLRICNEIDYIVIGEGELSLRELLENLRNGQQRDALSGIKGLAFLEQDKFIKTDPRPRIEDLDVLPMPAYHLLSSIRKNKTICSRQNSIGCSFSRGCNKKCKFCSENSLWGGQRRQAGAKRIAEELEVLVKKYNKNEFNIGDVDFFYDRRRNIELLNELNKKKMKIKFRASGRIDTILENRDLLEDFRKSGLVSLAVGIESFQAENLKSWNKQTSLSEIDSLASCVNKAKIPVFEALMILSPGDDKLQICKMLKKACNLKVNILWSSIVTPFPGTRLYEEKLSKGKILVRDYRRYDLYHNVMAGKNKSIKRTELFNIIVYLLFFYNPVNFVKNLFNKESLKFQLFQWFFDFRILRKLTYSAFSVFYTSGFEKKYLAGINGMYRKHLNYVNKSKQEPGSIKVWYK